MPPNRKYDPFDHATHNLEAHKALAKADGDFSDWEITTAFYAALKFFEGSLFPNTHWHPAKNEKAHFDNYNNYKSAYNKFVAGTPHNCMKQFVKQNTTAYIWMRYDRLYDFGHNARYRNYQVDAQDLKAAKESLQAIRSYCIENQR